MLFSSFLHQLTRRWDYGGLPSWLNKIPGMVLRSYDTPFINAMTAWVQHIVDMVRPFFPDRGGPIILAQIENEYSPSTPGIFV